jgi:hypothetical protein
MQTLQPRTNGYRQSRAQQPQESDQLMFGTADVYGCQGIMPDAIPGWIQTHKGIRRLQHQELAKAKGYLEESEMPHSKGGLNSVQMGTCGHIMTAVMDRAGEWLKDILIRKAMDPLKSDMRTEDGQEDDDTAETMWSTNKEDVKPIRTDRVGGVAACYRRTTRQLSFVLFG